MYLIISRRIVFTACFIAISIACSTLRAQEQHSSIDFDSVPDAPLPVGQEPQQTAPTPQPQSQGNQSAEDLKKEEKQRILGIMPEFNMMNNAQAPPLTSKQKFHLFWKSSTDPFVFLITGIDAGISQAEDDFPGYGQGVEGYFKRFGASYADTFDGNLWGNAILPVLLHEDPRYFRKGTGSVGGRIVHAALSTVWCRRDNGTWGPNYANVMGNIIGGGISNAYYPDSDRGVGLTFGRAFTVTAEGAIGAQLIEFWPDISRKFLHKHSQPADVPSQSASSTSNNQ
jgi:hypothetical protein